ncbi:MAG: hypothetical protein IH628_09180, partial [Proteobacteria bacterium]|nr:hypothetical protein [Pseudomonadota bacterium]
MSGKMVIVVGGVVFWTVFAAGANAAAQGEVTYEKDVRKIISAHCLSCHGSDAPAMAAY